MRGEGFAASDIKSIAEVDISVGKKLRTLPIRGKTATVTKAAEAVGERGRIHALRFSAECEVSHWVPVKADSRARKAPRPQAKRTVRWAAAGRLTTPVYVRANLLPGQSIGGPAMVDGPDTSYAIAPGWRLDIDDYSNFIFSRDDS